MIDYELLGTSDQGRDIELLTITNDASTDPDKEDIFIIGRQHSAENGSSYMIQGLIDFLISDDVDAATLRDRYTWYIVPMATPTASPSANRARRLSATMPTGIGAIPTASKSILSEIAYY